MCDACINAGRAVVASLSDEQRLVVERYIEEEVERRSEELDQDNDNLTESMDKANLIVAQLRDLLGENHLTLHTPIDELVLHVQNYARTIELLAELSETTTVKR